MYLRLEKEGDAGQAHQRQLYVGRSWHGQRVDVRFDHGTLSVIAKDHNGRDGVVRSGIRRGREWTLTREEFSRLPGVRTTTAQLPPPIIDPTQAMVVTRRVDERGRVPLGCVKEGDAGKLHPRLLNVGRWLYSRQVDVHVDNGRLFVIAKNDSGHDAVVRLGNHENWTLTEEEFSRLRGVRNTVVSEAVRLTVTGAAEGHTGRR